MLGLSFLTDFHQTYSFLVAVDNMKYAAFNECVLPNVQVKTEEVVEGGQNAFIHKLPTNVDVGTFTLKRGITRNKLFLKWYMQVVEGKIKDSTKQVTLIMLDSLSIPLMTFNFRDAYPVKWRGPSLKSDTSAVAIEEVEFVHHGFEVG
jgi:phage tail-like protein